MRIGGLIKPRWAAAAALALLLVVAALLVLGAAGHDDRDGFAQPAPPPGLAERFYPPENWAWGFVQVGDGPIQRYGVSGTPSVARAQVLILPGYGETAETWFETARDLNAEGYVVWVLDGVGQGGSSRLSGHRDLGEVISFDADVAGARAMIERVIRPAAGMPLIVLGQGVGGLVAAREAETGDPPAGLVLSAPPCAPEPPDSTVRFLGLGQWRSTVGGPWTRDGPDAFAAGYTHDRWRGAVTRAWQLANPDLRMGGPSLDWLHAFADLQSAALGDLGRIQAPILALGAGSAGACLDRPGLTYQAIAGAGPSLELEDDAHRGPWLSAVEAFLAAHAKPRAPAPGHGL